MRHAARRATADQHDDEYTVKGHTVLMSRASDEWATPQDFFDAVNAKFGPFTLDAAATSENAKAARFFTKEDDALAVSWDTDGRIWLNPPYSRIREFCAKARDEAVHGNVIVLLVPARTDTRWWHDVTVHADVRLLRGRLKFGSGTGSAPFPSALVILGPDYYGAEIQNDDWQTW